jgi:hypothetical protein
MLIAAGDNDVVREMTLTLVVLKRPVVEISSSLFAGFHIAVGIFTTLTLAATDVEIHSIGLLCSCSGDHIREDDSSGSATLPFRAAFTIVSAAGIACVVRITGWSF